MHVRLFWLSISVAAAQIAPNWTQQSPQTSPPPRVSFAMVYDSNHGQVVLFGGMNESGALNDTWVWDGSNWAQKSPQNRPQARLNHAMAYDAANGQVVLFGGSGYGVAPVALFSDTWVWDGSNWIQQFPQMSPKNAFYAMAFDAGHAQTVLFGGGAFRTPGDTWVWDGSNWTQKSPQNSPPARSGHAMAYDAAHGLVVLFGGQEGPYLNDTWVWDGSNWTQQLPQTSPSPRSLHAMAYDAAHGQVVLFGGVGRGADFNDTWVWGGSNWAQESPPTSPSERIGHAMAYDTGLGQTVLFGGFTLSPFYFAGDTWTWIGGAPPPTAPSIGSVVSASAFGGFSIVGPGSFVEIYGLNLAPDTRGWTSADFKGNEAPTSLDGVQVDIGGQEAFVDYISAGQVNALLPSDTPLGPQLIRVTNNNATTVPYNVIVQGSVPGLLAPSSFKIGGKQYVVAFLSDGVTYVLPTGAIPGIPSRPAKPGETIVIYGNGFGPVSPVIPAGQLVHEINQLTLPLEMFFGATSAKLAYFGLSPGLVGVYQFNVVVPAIADSDTVPLTFNLGGAAGTQVLYTAVAQ